jgi:large subunit ribosomal protein L22e
MKKTTIQPKEEKKEKVQNFVIDCSKPVEDKVFVTSNFAQYLRERIKIHGKIGKLGENIKIADDGNKVNVNAVVAFSKRYLKYLTKKYLKKHSLREFLYVIAKDKKTYEIKYFNIQQEEGADE